MMISVGKAVNPVDIIQMSKRMAEVAVWAVCARKQLKPLHVGFRNELGDLGVWFFYSVSRLPRSEPVTLTHPNMTRFFVTIP